MNKAVLDHYHCHCDYDLLSSCSAVTADYLALAFLSKLQPDDHDNYQIVKHKHHVIVHHSDYLEMFQNAMISIKFSPSSKLMMIMTIVYQNDLNSKLRFFTIDCNLSPTSIIIFNMCLIIITIMMITFIMMMIIVISAQLTMASATQFPKVDSFPGGQS